jgi:glycosyltransferase involved in cell wall biosynthesis
VNQRSAYSSDSEILIDVSRLVWRSWEGKLPTGIDRVCLAYLEHFKERSRAVVQRGRLRLILPAGPSRRLFEMILDGQNVSRLTWIKLTLELLPVSWGSRAPPGSIYVNVGHTGLDNPTLAEWIVTNRLRAIFMVHDLIPLTHPQFCRDGEDRKHARRMETVLASAAGIIANSIATRVELEKFAASRNLQIPSTIASPIAGHQPRLALDWKPSKRPYFVTLGTIEGRKNHQLLLRLWHSLVSDMGELAPELLIIGQRGWKADDVFRQLDDLGPLKGHVRELNGCDDLELTKLVSGARALLMPSIVEGFGLPVIEAFQLSVPVVASDLAVYREIAGETPAYVDPYDVSGWEAVVRDLLDDGEERQRQLRAIPLYQPPTWEGHFRKVEAWLPSLRSKGGRGN